MARLTIGRFIRNQRLLLRMTQQELSELINRDQTYVSQLEHDRVKSLPRPEFLRKLCAALRTTPEALFRSTGYLPEDESTEPDVELSRFAHMLREVEQLELPEHLKDLLRQDISFLRDRAEAERSIDAASHTTGADHLAR